MSSVETRHLTLPIPLPGGGHVILEGDFPIAHRVWRQVLTVFEAMEPGLTYDDDEPQSGVRDDQPRAHALATTPEDPDAWSGTGEEPVENRDSGGCGEGPDDLSSHARWRVGRKVGRTVYRQVGEEPSDQDQLIGVMDTPEWAMLAVEAVNRSLPAGRGETAALTPTEEQ